MSEQGPVRKLVETLKVAQGAMGLTLEQTADVIDLVIRLKGEAPDSMTAVAEAAKKWVQ